MQMRIRAWAAAAVLSWMGAVNAVAVEIPLERLAQLEPPILVYTARDAETAETTLYAASATGGAPLALTRAPFLEALALSEGDIMVALGTRPGDVRLYVLDLLAPSAMQGVSTRAGIAPTWFRNRAEHVQVNQETGDVHVLIDASGAGDLEWIRYNFRTNTVVARQLLSRQQLQNTLRAQLSLHVSPNGKYIAFFERTDTPVGLRPGTRKYVLKVFETTGLNRVLTLDFDVFLRLAPESAVSVARPSLIWLDGENVLYPSATMQGGARQVLLEWRTGNAVSFEAAPLFTNSFTLPLENPTLYRDAVTRQIRYVPGVPGQPPFIIDPKTEAASPLSNAWRPALRVEGQSVTVTYGDRVRFAGEHFGRALPHYAGTLDQSAIAFVLAAPPDTAPQMELFAAGNGSARSLHGPAPEIRTVAWLPLGQ